MQSKQNRLTNSIRNGIAVGLYHILDAVAYPC